MIKVKLSTCENVLLTNKNKDGYTISLIARFEKQLPVSYIIRVTSPQGNKTDYMCTLNNLKQFCTSLKTLQSFSETELYSNNIQELKKVLTAQNIKDFANLLKSNKLNC
ncbi:MAG: hypothetical protein NWF03_03655 [Candidatus Bathyarchaeota archaeon]|nr:hypothetical protein [Candidatus Bathyarchaeota archaeon]